MNDDITIRTASKDDLQTIVDLAIQWEREGSTVGQVTGSFDHYLSESGYLIVAEENQSMVAFLAAQGKNERLAIFGTEDPYVELEELYVAPERRSQGIGTLLVDELKVKAKTRGLNRFHVYSASRDLHKVIAFYARHGFQVWSIQAYANNNHDRAKDDIFNRSVISVGEVETFCHRFENLAAAEDFSLVAHMVHEKAVFRFTDGDFVGRMEVQRAFEDTWSQGADVVDEKYYLSDLQVLSTDYDTATVTYTYNWEGKRSDGTFRITGRGTRVIVRVEGELQIMHEHLSRFPSA